MWPAPRALPTPAVQRFEHVVDGHQVVAAQQWLAGPGVTLIRWSVDGQPAGETARTGGNEIPPDWSTVDWRNPTNRVTSQ